MGCQNSMKHGDIAERVHPTHDHCPAITIGPWVSHGLCLGVIIHQVSNRASIHENLVVSSPQNNSNTVDTMGGTDKWRGREGGLLSSLPLESWSALLTLNLSTSQLHDGHRRKPF